MTVIKELCRIINAAFFRFSDDKENDDDDLSKKEDWMADDVISLLFIES